MRKAVLDGRGNPAPTIGCLATNCGHASHKCHHTLASWVMVARISYFDQCKGDVLSVSDYRPQETAPTDDKGGSTDWRYGAEPADTG